MESWMDLFKAVFSANSPEWERTLIAWATLFHSEGWSDDQIRQAVRRVALREVRPKFPSDLTAALHGELRAIDQMAKKAREAFRLEYRPPVCDYCKDSGWVSGLPHLECVEGPVWTSPRWTMACTCCCDKGRRFNDHFATRESEPKKIMGFLEYTKHNPHFHAQMSQRQLEKAAELAAHEQQHGPHPGRTLLEKVMARHQATLPEANFQNAGGHSDASGEVEIQTDEHGEIVGDLSW
jgi:hypothetical protein